MRVADAEPITGGVIETRGVIGLSAPAAVPLVHEGMKWPLKNWLGMAHEVTFVAPGGPHDASELVGERDCGLVVTASFLQIERPGS